MNLHVFTVVPFVSGRDRDVCLHIILYQLCEEVAQRWQPAKMLILPRRASKRDLPGCEEGA